MNFTKKSKGITLIALVITIIVLLILAGVTLSLVSGGDGILGRAENAVTQTNTAKISEEIELAMAKIKTEYYEEKYVEKNSNLSSNFGEYVKARLESKEAGQVVGIKTSSGNIKFGANKQSIVFENEEGVVIATGSFEEKTGGISILDVSITGIKVTIPEGFEIGSIVSYTPSGTYNEWTAERSGYTQSYNLASGSSYNENDTTLKDMTISSWKVFKINENTGEVQLVPSTLETPTVGLGDFNGYNNGIKLLNDACSALYSNAEKGVKARSINIEDIEDREVSEYDKNEYVNTSDANESVNCGEQKSYEYTTDKTYPAIYAKEKNSVITPVPQGTTKTLNSSDAAQDWILGSATADTSIQPYQTYYKIENSDLISKLKGNYYEILIPNGTNTKYWIASRCVTLGVGVAGFYIRCIGSGALGANDMIYSNGTTTKKGARQMFPVVTLNVSQINGDTTTGWSI